MRMSEAEMMARGRAAGDHGIVSWAQLDEAGVSHSLALRRVAAGRWQRPHREIYVVSDLVGNPLHTMAGAALLAGPAGAVTSHLLAGHLQRLEGLPTVSRPELTVVQETGDFSTAGLVVHRTARLEKSSWDPQGFPATSVSRTLADLSSRVSLTELVCAIDSALHQGRVTTDDLQDVAARWGRRPGVAQLRQAVALCAFGAESPLETRVRLAIVRGSRRLPMPDLQIIVLIDGVTYRIDLGYLRWKIAIEADGRSIHEREQALFADRRKQNALVNNGWHPLRFIWEDLDRGDYIERSVYDAIAVQSRRLGLAAPGA